MNFADSKTIGERLRKKRLQHGWSVRDLRMDSGLSLSIISRVENGGQCELRTFLSLCASLEANPGTILKA